jgi:hypothetical protein
LIWDARRQLASVVGAADRRDTAEHYLARATLFRRQRTRSRLTAPAIAQ